MSRSRHEHFCQGKQKIELFCERWHQRLRLGFLPVAVGAGLRGLPPSHYEAAFLGTAHSDEEVQETRNAAKLALLALKDSIQA